MSTTPANETWSEVVVRVLKANEVKLVTYVPDNVLLPLIKLLHTDPYFTVLTPAREEEAVAIVAGAYMAGMRGITLMQTSGFATIPNALASLVCPFQIPLVMMVSERGTLGENSSRGRQWSAAPCGLYFVIRWESSISQSSTSIRSSSWSMA